MKLHLCLTLAFSLAFIGCGGGHQTINPEWKTAPESITILVSEPYIVNEDDVTDDFETVEKFRTWAVNYLDTSFSSYTNVKHSVKQVSDEFFEIVGLPIDKETVNIPTPVVEKLEGINGFVVSIHPLRFWREISPCLGGNGCIGNKHLNLMVAYSIVRVEDKQIQAYGATYVDDTFTFAMTKGNWENVLEKIAKKIVKKTPLEK